MVGALVLATRAAVRMGAGKVYALSVAADTPAFDPLAPEVMWRQLTKAPFAKIWDGCDCLAVGVGLEPAPRPKPLPPPLINLPCH